MHYILGYYHYADNKLDLAELKMKDVTRIEPEYWQAHKLLGDIFFKQKEIRYTQQRLSHNPDDVSELNNLARAYSGTGDYQKAKAIIEKVIIMMPDYRDAYITLAMIEEKENNLDAALEALRTAKTFAAHTGFIDKYIADIKNKAHPSLKAAHTARPKEIFIPSHKILFKSGRSIEGTVHSKTEDEVVLSVLAGKSELKLVFRADDIDRIETHKQKAK
jgi:tetratricopeptide (TPR) repeat protein